MVFPGLKKLRYFSISNPDYCLGYMFKHSLELSFSWSSCFKHVASAKPYSSAILSSNHNVTKSTGNPSSFFFSLSGSSSFSSMIYRRFSGNDVYISQMSSSGLLKSHSYGRFRCFSLSSMDDLTMQCESKKQVSDIIQLIRSNDDEMESKLNSMKLELSAASLNEIFRVLNCDKVSALGFFNWIRQFHLQSCYNSDVCSLVIDNCGRRDDYEEMRSLLKEFSLEQYCLSEKAFKFLPVMLSSEACTKKAIWRVVEVLNEVGGSCRVSGVRALIEMFSILSSFKMAKYVIKKTERKVSYYNIIMKEMCRRCYFEDARGTLDEMRQVGCEPNTQTYNYLLGGLCKKGKSDEARKVFEDMKEKSCLPDEVTYEIFIYNSCKFGDFDTAYEFLDQMVLKGLEPRISTHAALIKGYFRLGRYEEAYKYVVDSADKYKYSTNTIYSLLASLHDRNRNLDMAQNVLVDMIDKGLIPSISVYRRVLKHLRKFGREDMAGHLSSKFSSLSLPAKVDA